MRQFLLGVRRCFACGGLLVAVSVLAGGGLRAQEPTPAGTAAPTEPVAELTAETVQMRLKQLDEATGLDATVKTKASTLYKQALEQLRAAEEHAAKANHWIKLRSDAPQRADQQRAVLTAPPAEATPVIAAGTTLVQLEQMLADAQARLAAAQKELTSLEAEPRRRTERRSSVPQRLQELKQQLADADAALAAKPPVGEVPQLTLANQTLMLARKQTVQREIQALEQELPTHDATVELLTLDLRVAERRAAQAERLVQALQQVVEKRRGEEAVNQLEQARLHELQLAEANAPRELQELAAEVVELARRRIEPTEPDETVGLAAKIARITADLESAQTRLEKLAEARHSVEEKLPIPGIESVIGPLLLEQKRALPDVGRQQQAIAARQTETSRVRLTQISLQEQTAELKDLDAVVAKIVAALTPPPPEAERARWTRQTRELLDFKRQVLDALKADYATYFNKLVDLSTKEQQLIAATASFAELIDKHILWIRSIGPWDRSQLPSAWRALRYLTSPEHWTGLAVSAWQGLVTRPLLALAALLGFALLVGRQRRLRQKLRTLGTAAARSYLEPIAYTLEALLLTVVLSAIWPAGMWCVGWFLASSLEATEFARTIGAALMSTSWALWTLQILRTVCRPYGLAESHFRWYLPRVHLLRRSSRWMMLAGLPVVFVVLVLENQRYDDYKTTLGRLTLVVGLLLVAPAAARIVRAPAIPSGTSTHPVPPAPMSRFQVLGYIVALLGPWLLAVLAAVGFYYTALQLSWRLLMTLWLVLALTVLHDTAIRWLYGLRGRWALKRLEHQRAAEDQAPAAAPAGPAPAGSAPPEPGERPPGEPAPAAKPGPAPADRHALDLADVNVQTRRLLHIALLFALAVGVWMIWADVLPALKLLDLPVWSTTSEVTRVVPGPQNVLQHERFPETKVITLGDLAIALAIVVLAFIAARNVPGLLEVVILRHLPLDSGGRYAIITLARYALNVLGLIVGFQMVGIGWSQVQWLVAAMTFGLAFGMQEVFANFVSGVILLFERPIRVGDVVTVDNVTGTVTRIRMRATTIRNWDCQEFIVPNKELMTGRLLNWTLSDRMNRIVIPVGVAYGSDTERVRALLLDIVRSHPAVLADPAPSVSFEQFGESSLNFVVRVFLHSFDRRLETIHELHTAIHRRFAAAGIEIPFPQRDLHIRSDARSGPPPAPRQ